MIIQQNIAQSFQSPVVRVLLAVIAIALLYVLWKEVRKIPAKLFTLMATAFMDMVGLLMIIPLLPFYVKELGGSGVDVLGLHFGIGSISGFIVASFTVAQLISAPMWGRLSDRVGRRPVLLIALGAAGIAYLIFGFAHSLFLLFLSRMVQGAGGGTVGVIQAYVADSTDPKDRARALGWLSATTNLGVALGPVLGTFAIALGQRDLMPGSGTLLVGRAMPGIIAAGLCVLNMIFVARFLKESRESSTQPQAGYVRPTARQAIWRVISQSSMPSSRLILIYAISIGAYQGSFSVLALFLNARFQVTEQTIGYFFMYLGSDLGLYTRVAFGAGGRLARGSESIASGACVAGFRRSRNALVAKFVDAGARGGADSAGDRVYVSVRNGALVTGDFSRRTRPVHGDATDLWRNSPDHRAAILWLGV